MNKQPGTTLVPILIVFVSVVVFLSILYFGIDKKQNTSVTPNVTSSGKITTQLNTVVSLKENESVRLKDYRITVTLQKANSITTKSNNTNYTNFSSELTINNNSINTQVTLGPTFTGQSSSYDIGDRIRLILVAQNMVETQLEFQKIFNTEADYTCPLATGINCMPLVPPELQQYCNQKYITWAKNHCPNFQGAVY